MALYGNPNSLVGITLELRPMGPVPVTIGTGIVGIVGTSSWGPVEAVGLTSASLVKTLYDAGDLKEAGELAFYQGVPNVYLVRVLGAGYATASADLVDGGSPAVTVGTLRGRSPGVKGNSFSYKIENGDYKGTDVEIFNGQGVTVLEYALDRDDLVEDSSNYVKVNGVSKELVYNEPTTGKVYVNKTKGTINFFTGQGPTTADQISVSIKFNSRKMTVYDGTYQYVFNNIKSLEDLQAKLAESNIVEFVPAANVTHLPKATPGGVLSGGSDGSTITTNDWVAALNRLAAEVSPTTVALTQYEVSAGTYDLVPILDGWLTYMANQFRPCLGFVACKKNEDKGKIMDLCAGYNNRLLTIVANAWDAGEYQQNIAVARAAKEAACALGESAARSYNSMNGLEGLLQIFSDDDVDTLSRNGADVIILKRGIRPYLGISTATDWQFMRCVDNRTINWVILAVKHITDQFYHERRTKTVLTSLKASIVSVLEEQIELENIRAYTLSVSAHPIDTGRVDIDLQMENIGHIERFRVLMQVGVMEGGGFTV